MTYSTVEAALQANAQPGSVAPKVVSALQQEVRNDEVVANAHVALVGTPTSSGDPIGVVVMTDQRILTAYKPSGLMARPEVDQRRWEGLSMAAKARAGEDPAVAVYHDAGDLFINCGQGRDSARDAIVEAAHRLLLRHVEEFCQRPDVAAWLERLGRDDIRHVDSSHGYGSLVKDFPDSELVKAVMPGFVSSLAGILTLTENRLFYLPCDGNQDWLLNTWPGGIGRVDTIVEAGRLHAVLTPMDPDQWLAGAEMKGSVLGLDHTNPVEVTIGLDTPRETLEDFQTLLEEFSERPPHP